MVAPKISEMSQKWRKMHWEFLKYIETVLKCTENFFNALECPEKHKIFPKFIWKFFKDTKYSCNESRIMENGLREILKHNEKVLKWTANFSGVLKIIKKAHNIFKMHLNTFQVGTSYISVMSWELSKMDWEILQCIEKFLKYTQNFPNF